MAANSIVTKTGDGVTTDFTFSFTGGYMDESHVFCQVNAEVDGTGDPVYRPITFLNAGTISIGGAVPGVGHVIRISRITPIETSINDFSDGDILSEYALDLGFEQIIKSQQELRDALILAEDAEQLVLQAEAAATATAADAVATAADRAASNVHRGVAQSAAAAAALSESNVAANANSITANAVAAATAEAEGYRDEAETFKDQAEAAATVGLPARIHENSVDNLVTDLDLALDNGYYGYSASAVNAPYAASGTVHVTRHNNKVTQVVMSTSTGDMYWRTRNSSAFTAWSRIYNATHSGDAAQEAKFLQKTGGAMTGNITISSGASNGELALITGSSSRTGRIEFNDAAGTRFGYMGYGTADQLEIYADGGRHYNFNRMPWIAGADVLPSKTSSNIWQDYAYFEKAAYFRTDVTYGTSVFSGGSTTRTSYLGFWSSPTEGGALQGYIGYAATGGEIRLQAYAAGTYFNFNKKPRFQGTEMLADSYESAATPWVADTISYFAHGLGVIPKVIDVRLVHKTTTLGFIPGFESQVSSDRLGAVVYADATYVRVVSGNASGIYSPVPSGTSAYLTPAMADLKVRAYA